MDLQKTLDLRKEIVLDLKKKLNITDQKAQVVLCLDYSGSMMALYSSGKVQELVERILPLGLAFDDNGEVDTYIFSGDYKKLKNNVTLKNVVGYINKEVGGQMGGTVYTPVISAIVNEFSHRTKTGGFLGMGGTTTYQTMDLPVYVIFITDGDNSDHPETEAAMIEASKAGIFFQFVGIGAAEFSF